MKKIILVVLGLLVVGAGAFAYFFFNKKEATTVYTMEEVSKHSNRDSCWMVIEGKVYDVTGYIASGMHKGKDAILMGCGIDATAIYNNRPNGSGAHSKLAREIMAKFAIGVVKQ